MKLSERRQRSNIDMKRPAKLICIALLACVFAFAMAGCGSSGGSSSAASSGDSASSSAASSAEASSASSAETTTVTGQKGDKYEVDYRDGKSYTLTLKKNNKYS